MSADKYPSIVSRQMETIVYILTIFRAAGPPSKPEDYHRTNTFFTSLDKVLGETENRFSGNDQDVLCALGNVTPR